MLNEVVKATSPKSVKELKKITLKRAITVGCAERRLTEFNMDLEEPCLGQP